MRWGKPAILARSTALFHMPRWQLCRRHPATVRQTTTAAVQAATASVREASMVAALGIDLAAKYPIGPAGVAEDQRHHDGDADQHQDLAVFRRCSLPDVDALRHDVGIHA